MTSLLRLLVAASLASLATATADPIPFRRRAPTTSSPIMTPSVTSSTSGTADAVQNVTDQSPRFFVPLARTGRATNFSEPTTQQKGLLAVFVVPANGGANTTIAVSKSYNNGAWQVPVNAATESPGTIDRLDNPSILQLPSGKILVAYEDRVLGSNSAQFRISLITSDDGAKTWSRTAVEPESRTYTFGTNSGVVDSTSPAPRGAPMKPYLRQGKDPKTVQLYYIGDGGPDTLGAVLMKESHDEGNSWPGGYTSMVTGTAGTDYPSAAQVKNTLF
ncbi:hypothetical protein B0T16DRAFT_392958 [Cercophora newfieldiana]|uniref:Sialidase domain-containing protein n=1 Tax=Cercophora newfieldiana TaxID=92897 RepID=A0AA40CN44_9PEZI|nr:hypothetical protein B0T16DRAFT_392958 [Cercophora newfieldiana]